MFSNVFIFHGTAGHPGENWFPWLKAELEARGHAVIVPQFPTSEGQSVANWMEVLWPYLGQINSQTILIGHSLGCLFLLRLLETLAGPVKAAVFVGAPIGVRPLSNYDNDERFVSGFNFDWPAIKDNSGEASVFHSDNDPYVGLGNGQALAKHLGVELSLVPGAGHFNTASGYTKFEELLDLIKAID